MKKLASSFASAFLFSFFLLPSAESSEVEKIESELLESNPTATLQEIRHEVGNLAEENGKSYSDQIRDIWITDRSSQITIGNGWSSDSEESTGTVELPLAKNRGDVFYAMTSGFTRGLVNYGHNGIYIETDRVIEALGPEQLATIYTLNLEENSHRVNGPVHLMEVKTDQETRDKAADWAQGKENVGYNTSFFNNRKIDHSHYNCSQLVWAAYMAASNSSIDIDGNGGAGVYPKDILDSEHTETYLVFGDE